jgi:hypothetical protein
VGRRCCTKGTGPGGARAHGPRLLRAAIALLALAAVWAPAQDVPGGPPTPANPAGPSEAAGPMLSPFAATPGVPSGEPVAARAEGPWRLIAIDDLARALGAPWREEAGSLTLRAASGVLVAFVDSPDAWWQALGEREANLVSAALPVVRVDGRFFLPEDLLGVLGVRVVGDALVLPDGRARPLAIPRPVERAGLSEVVQLGPGVEGLRLFAAAASGPDVVSLLAVDLGLMGLAFPAQQVALDAVLRELKAEKALFLVVTALADAAWQPAIYVVQDGIETLLSSPLTVQVLEGDPDRVGPGRPVAAVAFLPPDLDLRRPLTLRWAGVSGSWTLRR